MNRGKSGQIKIRKKSTFRPIMLTSKSIKPIDRSNAQRIKQADKSDTQDGSAVKRKSYHKYAICTTNLNRSQMIKKLTEQYRDELIKNIREECNSRVKKYKQFTASVVHVEFGPQERTKRSQSKNQNRYDSLGIQQNNNQNNMDALRKYFYCTNSRAFQYYSSATRHKFNNSGGFAGTTSNLIRSLSTKQCDEWNKCLNKVYLNVRKICPQKIKAQIDSQQKIPQQKLQQITMKVEQYQSKLIKKMQSRSKINSSCLDDLSQDRNRNCQSPELQSLQRNITYIDRQKIQSDLLTKRQTNKKQHFVFGLSQIPKINPQQVNKQKFQIYKDFIWKINYSNGLYVYLKDQIESPYKLYVGPGNNGMLIKGIMKRRFWWQVTDKCNEQVNFVWTQIKINQFFKFQTSKAKQYQLLHHNHNHNSKLQNFGTNRIRKVHSAIGHIQKTNMTDSNNDIKRINNLEKIQNKQQSTNIEKKQQDMDSHRKIFKGKDYQIWLNHYEANKKHQDKLQINYSKRIKTLIRRKSLTYIQQSKNLKIQNHFECNYFLGNKKALFYSMKKYYTLVNKDPFQHIPLTFHISKGLDDPQYNKFIQKYQHFQEKKKNKQCQNIWIVKPGEMTNRGRGITVCSILDDVKVRLKSKEKAKNGQLHTYIVQKYIQRPLLYHKRKFDIRHYMLMTCVNGRFKGYWYQQGYLRTTSYEYNIKNCKDLYTHLTNDAIQKYSADYGKFQKGNKVSYADFQKYLNANYRVKNNKNNTYSQDKYDFYNYVLPKMKELATDCMRATYMVQSPQRYQHNFQLFGLDFMLDEDMNVYLIQVNTNPCLETSSPLLSKLIPSVIENVFKICVDPLFPPPYEWPNQRKMQMGQNSREENKFILVFDENQQGQELRRLYENANNDEQIIGAIDQEDEYYQDQGKQWVQQQR